MAQYSFNVVARHQMSADIADLIYIVGAVGKEAN